MADSGGTPATSVNNNPGQVPKQPSANPVKNSPFEAPMPGTFKPPGYTAKNMGAPDSPHTGVPS